MRAVLIALVAALTAAVRSHAALCVEVLALRHQLAVYRRRPPRPRLRPADRLLWAWLARRWSQWRAALVMVQPRTVIAWQRRRFRDHWARLSRGGHPGRPRVTAEVRALIRQLSSACPTWGSPRIVGELHKLGLAVAKSTVERYMVRPRRPPSPTWRAFLRNHVKDLVSLDFFVVATVRFELLFVRLIRARDRRRVLHCNLTAHPTAQWTAQQVVEAFPDDRAPRYLLRDRDAVYGAACRARVAGLGVTEVVTAPRSPWQNPFAERLVGSVRRECLANVVVLSERHLRRVLRDCFAHYHAWRCHRALALDCPTPRAVQPPAVGPVIEVAEAGGRYRHFERRAA